VAHLLPALRRGSDRLAAVLELRAVDRAGADLPGAADPREHAGGGLVDPCLLHRLRVGELGPAAGEPAHRDLFAVLGADRLKRFARLELPAALPALASGLRLAWPAALIGAIIGEWFGAPRGIGILIINAMQNFQIVLLWCAVLLAVGASLLFYGLLTLLERAAYARFG
jgi:NitT/TauT family transport system permease protein